MKKRRVYCVDLGTGHNLNVIPLGCAMVVSYAMSLPRLAEAFDFDIRFLTRQPDALAASLSDPAVVGFSCYVWNVRASLAAARAVKARFPRCVIVMGGYGVPASPDRLAPFFRDNPFVDVVVHGEGEVTFASLLEQIVDTGSDLASVNGISARSPGHEEGFFTTPRRERIADLSILPSPFLNGVLDGVVDAVAKRSRPEPAGAMPLGALWETSRGCPFGCAFCEWGGADRKTVARFDLDRLRRELDWIAGKGFTYLNITDSNFGITPDRDLMIADWIADVRRRTGLPHHIVINWAKDKHSSVIVIAERLKDAGLAADVTLSLQSLNPETLSAINRRNAANDLPAIRRMYHERGITTYTELILGLPPESYTSFAEGIELVMTPLITDHFQIYLCQVLENTPLALERGRYGLETRFCPHGVSQRVFEKTDTPDFDEIVVGTDAMPIEDWQRAYRDGYLAVVLYNFRIAFFVMNYLKETFGMRPMEFLRFVAKESRAHATRYPSILGGIRHIEQQGRRVLAGEGTISVPDDLAHELSLAVSPDTGAYCLMTRDMKGLEEEIRRLMEGYCDAMNWRIDHAIAGDLVRYQMIKLPVWSGRRVTGAPGTSAAPGSRRLSFQTTLPLWFDALCSGGTPPPILPIPTERELIPAASSPATYRDYVASLVRSGHVLDVHEDR